MGVINKDGALYFATGIDNSGLKKDSEEAKRYIQDIANFAKSTGAVLGTAFSVEVLKNFSDEIINARGEMQMLESSFEVLLGGKGVPAFMDELKKFAVDSPLSLSNVGDATQMLLAFGVEAENVIPVVKQLGDISMGNSQKFQSLALAYSQMTSAGKVLSQDLRQMATAGFNPLGEIAKMTGKTIQEVNKMMDDEQITVKQVTDAFASATSEGGKFYGMTQKQAEGIKGLQAQLEGAWQGNFNNLGKKNKEAITGMYKIGISIAENYEKIGRVIASLIATYGAYKAALVVVTTAESGWTLAQMTKYKWLVLVEKAQRLLYATMLKNPYVAVTVLVVGLVSAIVALRDRTTMMEKAQKQLNAVLDEANDRKESLKTKGGELISVLTSETATVYQQIKAYKELLTLLPQLKGKSLDEIKAMKPEDIEALFAERSDQVEIETVRNRYEELTKNIEGYRKKIKELVTDGADSATISYYREQLGKALAGSKVLKGQLDEISRIQKEAFYQENPEARRMDLQVF
jgi:tape measure domain-containing protein